MRVAVKLASALRVHADGASQLLLEVPSPATVRSVLDSIAADHPAVARRLRDEAGELRTHVNVFVGPDNVRDLGGLDAPVPEGAEVAVLPAVSGG